MAAAAFVANLVFQYADGYRENIACTVSDVNAGFYLGPDGLSPIHLNGSHGNVALVDVLLSAAGTDTRTATIRVNSKADPNIVLNGANVGTVVGRQFQQTPLRLPSGATLLFTQVT
jgi:hypothetical protein